MKWTAWLTPSLPCKTAADLVGPSPTGALRDLTLAVRHHLRWAFRTPTALLLAVSGGSDSLALALATLAVAPRLGHEVVTLTIDHAARDDSADEAARVRDQLTALGARAEVRRVQAGSRGGPEGALRQARWEALHARARALGGATPAPILTGHTADDQAETVLLALARGSGTRAMAGMASGLEADGAPVHRPLLSLRRDRAREALRQVGLTWIDDPTNAADGPWRTAAGAPLPRAGVREHALPALAASLGVDPVAALGRTAQLARQDGDALDELARGLVARALERAADHPARGTNGGETLVAAATVPLEEALPALRTRALIALSVRAGARPGDLGLAHVREIDRLVTDWRGQGPIDLPGRVRVRRCAGEGVLVWWRVAPAHSV